MDVPTPVVQEFFEQYVRSRSTMDIDHLVSQYADSCMFAAHDGVRVVEKSALLAGLPKALELLKSVGHTSTTLASLSWAPVGCRRSPMRRWLCIPFSFARSQS
jgi:hypothetical protein